VDETTLLTSRKFRVVRVRETLRDGSAHQLDVVRHPGAAVILPLLEDDRVVLLRNRRATVGRALLELPAGTIDPGESPIDCAARELTEETGYSARRLRPLIRFLASPGICDEWMHVFLAEGLTPGTSRPEHGEELDIEILHLDELLHMIRDGRVEDGKTIAAVLYLARFGRDDTPRNH